MIINYSAIPCKDRNIHVNKIKHPSKSTHLKNLTMDCVSFGSVKQTTPSIKTRLKSFINNAVSFNGNLLETKISKIDQAISKEIDALTIITPENINKIVHKHLKSPERFIAKDISNLPTERKLNKAVIAHRTMNLKDSSVILFVDSKANMEKIKASIKSEMRSHLEDLEIQKQTETFRDKICQLEKTDKPSIEKIISELKLSDKIKIVDSSKEPCPNYYKQLPAICVPDVSDPKNPISTIYVNFSMGKMDLEQCMVHEFVHTIQIFKEKNFFIDNETLTKETRTQIDQSTKNLDLLLQNVFNSEQNYFNVIDKSELPATERKYDLFKAAIGRELQDKGITDTENYLNYIQLWALHEAEAYKEGIITIKSNPGYAQMLEANTNQSAQNFIGTEENPIHIGLELLPRYYQEFANCINNVID